MTPKQALVVLELVHMILHIEIQSFAAQTRISVFVVSGLVLLVVILS